ncbi:hypothetical protein [Massilia aerilata]|uniref:Uncharacterized protein n=1 Tax=Massilia aerilata TaxID=453817 RepID=A0ABW0RZN6_9BURK
MPKDFAEFISMMDERLWFRMIVCMLPGLVAAKLVGSADNASFTNNVATAVLVIGVLLYVFWGRIRGISKNGETDVEPEVAALDMPETAAGRAAESISAKEQLAVLSELRALCQEAESESDRLIAIEIAVSPNLSFAEAARNAVARRRIAAE